MNTLPTAGLLGPVHILAADQLIAEDSSTSDSESKESAHWAPAFLPGGYCGPV